MPKTLHCALSPLKVKSLNKPGTYADGLGLYLVCTPSSDRKRICKSWVFRFTHAGRVRDMGLGGLDCVPLADARAIVKGLQAKRKADRQYDPIAEKRAERAARAKPTLKAVTFDEAAEQLIERKSVEWRGKTYRENWQQTLRDYASPIIGKLPVAEINIQHVCHVLDLIWTKLPTTAMLVRSRLEQILDYAAVKGYRSGDNPARWRGHLSLIYAKTKNLREQKRTQQGKGKNHAALPHTEISEFLREVRAIDSDAAQALELIILTASRASEITEARWDEINFETKTWTIPKERMKSNRPHRIPLSEQVIAILRRRAEVRQGEFVFAGEKAGRPMGAIAPYNFLRRRLERSDLTTHGFRSTFRDWTSERTNFKNEICEAALAHKVKDQTEAAYRRGDLLEKRRPMMEAWARYCNERPATKGSNVTAFKRA